MKTQSDFMMEKEDNDKKKSQIKMIKNIVSMS